jgi:cytosine-specific methyltransferase|nr:MAG TPA: Cytosine specific methyltransferase [Caudoviricetes sp.]
MTLQQYQTTLFDQSEMLTQYVAGFRARLSQLPEKDKALKTHEVPYFLKLHGSPLFSNLEYYFLKTSKDYLTMTKDERLEQFSKRWTDWGMTWNGKYLIANISEYLKTANVCSLSDILEKSGGVDEKYFLSSQALASLVTYHDKEIHVREATKKGYAVATVGDSVNLSHPNSKTRRGRVGKQIANTILTGTEQAVISEDLRIRKLTPRECWRLQGFPDYAFDRAQKVNSDSQLYKQAGNSVTVNVIEAIAKEL